MAAVTRRHLWWDRLGRSLLGTDRARVNAADSLRDLQQTRGTRRAKVVDALSRPGSSGAGAGLAADGTIR